MPENDAATVEKPKKRRGRPPKVRVEEAPVTKPRPPLAPVLAREVLDYILSKYDMKPGDWNAILTTMGYMRNMGGYWARGTKK